MIKIKKDVQTTTVLATLKKEYGTVKHYLHFKNPLQLLIAAILSPQVRDEMVNEATPGLFNEFKTAKAFAEAPEQKIFKHIKKISFAGKKAGYVKKACQALVETYNGTVPKSLGELQNLPGIGKKTAIVILSHAYDKTEGVAVDTHVLRVSYRLGWTKNKNADKVEQDLSKLLPKTWWKQTPLLLKAHGRKICKPKPLCDKCVVNKLCPKVGVKS